MLELEVIKIKMLIEKFLLLTKVIPFTLPTGITAGATDVDEDVEPSQNRARLEGPNGDQSDSDGK